MVKVLQLVAGCVLRQHEIELLWKEQSCWRRGWKPVVVVGVSGASGDEGSDVQVVFVWLIWQWKTWERKLCYEGFHGDEWACGLLLGEERSYEVCILRIF
jgi:hypothetical protein